VSMRFLGTIVACVLILAAAAGGTTVAQQTTPTENPFGGGAAPATPPTARKARRAPASVPALSAGQFAAEAEAKAQCGSNPVVWANTNSKIYHHAGTSAYGKTKRGAYMCEKDTASAGIRAAKNEKRR
jgi:hypothetical protein